MSVYCATTSFELFNSEDVWIVSFLCRMSLLYAMQIQWGSCWSRISEISSRFPYNLADPIIWSYSMWILVVVISETCCAQYSDCTLSWNERHGWRNTFWMWHRRQCGQLWNMLFLDFNILQKTVDSILNMFCTSLAEFINQLDWCFLCGFRPQYR